MELVSGQPLGSFVIHIGDVVSVENRCQAGIIKMGIQHSAFCDTTELNQPGIVFRQGITTTQSVVKSNKPTVVHLSVSILGQ